MTREEANYYLKSSGFSDEQIYTIAKAYLEPCDVAISRDMALEKMADYVASGYADSVNDFEEYSRIICQLPPVNPQPKTGHWIKSKDGYMRCDQCGSRGSAIKARFCHHCGARMVEPQESEDKE